MHYTKSCRLYAPYKEGAEMDHLCSRSMTRRRRTRSSSRRTPRSGPSSREDDGFAMGFVKDPNGIWVGIKSDKG